MQRSKFVPLSTLAIAALAALALAGCGAETGPSSAPADTADTATAQPDTQNEEAGSAEPAATDSSTTQGEATLSYGDTTYTAELQFCSFSGGTDSLFHGVAHDDAGNAVGYLTGDFGSLNDLPHGEARIDFGATGQFQSTDEFVAMGTAGGHIVVTDSTDSSMIVMGDAWDQTGTPLSTATLRVDC